MPQFSIRSLMVAIAVTSISCGILLGLSDELRYYATFYCLLLLIPFLTGLYTSQEPWCRSFSVGALPIAVYWVAYFPLSEGMIFANDFALSTYIGFMMLVIGGCFTATISRVSASTNESVEQRNGRTILNEIVFGLAIGLVVAATTGFAHFAYESFQQQSAPTQLRGGVI